MRVECTWELYNKLCLSIMYHKHFMSDILVYGRLRKLGQKALRDWCVEMSREDIERLK